MSFTDKINSDLKEAMLSKDKVRVETLRSVKKELIEARTAKGASGDEIDDDAAAKLIQKMAKQRSDSAAIYRQQNRLDLAEPEEAELEILSAYLPKQLSLDEVEAAIAGFIAELGVTSIKEMGKVIGHANKILAGKTEGRIISETVKRLLS